ncbi:Dus-domain-containing protein [Hesseltinella vesiculosa]|uniref:tRNA-dihydrouridine(16/17) synthase [NAD(P)(+)] n=1 Tax=Hesseltinella vesiculosa TaxID=101127 RepID=A0A1X2GM59_9FUNG|nr:Dus-domain-containing protein [Hesseltinella vesiculosa]
MSSAPIKLKGYDFFRQTLKSPKFVLAPMVASSELAYRALTRRHGATLCYTPMFHARLFSEPPNHRYRKEQWSTNAEDRPVIVQFCANDPDVLLKAARMVEDDCDAVDINLGCPQNIAKRGKYGSFLQEDWPLIEKLVKTLDENLKVPVTVKIRVFADVEKTVAYAKMVEAAGAQMLTVHGRLREQKGHVTGLADWDKIKAVKEAVNIPVLANGNILYYEDIQRCMDYTGVDGVMSAEATLYNPAIFDEKYKDMPPYSWEMALEYLEIAKEVEAITPCIKAHLFKLFQPALPIHTDLRHAMAAAKTWDDYYAVTLKLKERLQQDEATIGEENLKGQVDDRGVRQYGHWRCQVRREKRLRNDLIFFFFSSAALHSPRQVSGD